MVAAGSGRLELGIAQRDVGGVPATGDWTSQGGAAGSGAGGDTGKGVACGCRLHCCRIPGCTAARLHGCRLRCMLQAPGFRLHGCIFLISADI